MYLCRKNTNRRILFLIIFLSGFAIRVSLSLILYYTHPPYGQMFKDDYSYLERGTLISNLWKERIIPDYVTISGGRHYGYEIYNALHYYMLDDCNMLYPILSNCFFGAMLAVVIYYLAAMINAKIARTSLFLVAFFPNFIFWSAVNLKDTLLAFLFSLAMLIYLKSTYQPSFLRIVALISILFVAQTIRTYTTYMLLILMLFGYMINVKSKLLYRLTIIVPIVILFTAFPVASLRYDFLSRAMLFSLSESKERAIESTALTAPLYSYDLLDYVKYLPVHISRFMMTPRPWASEVLDFSNPYSALVPGMILWILITPYYIYGMWIMVKKYSKITFVLYSFAFFMHYNIPIYHICAFLKKQSPV